MTRVEETYMNASKSIVATLACALLAFGCASVPKTNPELDAARAAVEEAKASPHLTETAAGLLQDAQRDLTRAENVAADHGVDEPLVSHYAYLATREAQAATALAQAGEMKAAAEKANAERDRIRLEAREREVNQAKSQVAQAQDEAAEERAKSAEMQQRLADLAAKQTERGLVLTLQDVLFDVGHAELKPGGLRAVQKLAAFMQDYSDRRVRIEGFTDSTGSAEYNQQLSEQRAFAVKDALMQAGIDPDRIELQGYGESYPVASNDTNEGRQLNRRVEIVISDDSGTIPSRGVASASFQGASDGSVP
jgi:outer membrane protein OmpA-like peptidoglycan-associated protein